MRRKSLCLGWWLASVVLPCLVYAGGNAEAGKGKADVCAGCHGANGISAAPIFPNLAGQHAGYLGKQLMDFRSKSRADETMNSIAEELTDEDIADLSAYFASQSSKTKPSSLPEDPVGKHLFQGGNAERGIPACGACHGVGGRGLEAAGFPALRGQSSSYLAKTLTDYKHGERANDKNGMMRGIAAKLSEAEIKSVSDFISAIE